jgi:hypothetical protein
LSPNGSISTSGSLVAVTQEFSEAWARAAVAQLADRGVEFERGLNANAIDHIGEVFGTPVPEELALFLGAGVSTSPKWARWVDGPEAVAQHARR